MRSLRSCRTVRHLSRALLAGALVSAIASAASAADAIADGWTQVQGGAAHPGVASDAPAPPYEVSWRLPVAAGGPDAAFGVSAPVFDGSTVIVVGADEVVGADAATGAQAWSIDRAIGPSVPAAVDETDGLVLFTEGWGPAGPPRAATVSPTPSPTASPSSSASPTPGAGDEEFAGPSRLVAYALDGERQRAWSVHLPQVSRSGVTLDGTTAYVGTQDGSVTAVDAATGEVRWSTEAGGPIEVPIAVADGVVVASVRSTDAATGARLVAVHDDGTAAWTYAPRTASLLTGTPAIVDGSVYATTADALVHAVALDTGAVLWTSRLTAQSVFPVAITDDAVFATDVSGEVYRIDRTTGARVWEHPLNTPLYRAGPLVVGDRVVTATFDGDVVAFDVASGDLVWRGHVSDDPIRDLAADADALVVVGSRADTGVIGLSHDASGTLVREQSPTVFDLTALLVALGAVAVFVVLLFLVGRRLWARLGPPEFGEASDEPAADAWEQEEPEGADA
jgi:outer membrane protein assembly factor BamB